MLTLTLSVVFLHPLVHVIHHKACGHRAECWCGWASAWCFDYATADDAANHHRQMAAGPPTGLDAPTEELVALADLLAAPVVLETEPDADGRRRQRTTRDFGRVRIEACTEVS